MNHANLTARYRPQKFSELAGQETVRAILSRACLEDKIAPAYLFSGTRGVGKTTVARIFAKTLNCVNAPTAEPCNECVHCRQITQGSAVDVVEIDGASNRGIDDARKLKEVIGYAPMEGRYKIFIIDEAHMLTREAFNALLKTLEEPPARVTFILATTEPHKFPATIISRCQHYVFHRLPETELAAHLARILDKEGVSYEAGAVRLIVRRAAGSARDAMSLLGQALALGSETLTEETVRSVLGLAGQELFFSLFLELRNGNGAGLCKLVGGMLDSGLDLGFFLREMALCWRNMFILRQSGEAALSVLDIPEKEAIRWQKEASCFELAHIHAAWQMTIDGQRRVLTSLEPSLALELLLLNIAMLPRLLPLEGLAKLAGRGMGEIPPTDANGPASPAGPTSGTAPGKAEGAAAEPASGAASLQAAALRRDTSWAAFIRFCKGRQDVSCELMGMIQPLTATLRENTLAILPNSVFCAERMGDAANGKILTALAREYYGESTLVRILPPPRVKTADEVREALRESPAVRTLEQEMGARLVDYGLIPGAEQSSAYRNISTGE
ncbi:hypothetical protein FACS1894206_02110 [Deltaproteobacteria bacterium]|nr:hypothetical protein FACS1894206_02110 [Deltaproteobacteria bacterium]